MNLKRMKQDMMDMKDLLDIMDGHLDQTIASLNGLMGIETEIVKLEDKRKNKDG